MSENITQTLFAIVRAALKGERIGVDNEQVVTTNNLQEVLILAKKHDIAHLILPGLSPKILLDSPVTQNIKQLPLLAVNRYEKLNYELSKICNVFERNGIPFLPLKGTVLRKYYPEPWMRTSCDIDILVNKDDISNAITRLVDELEYVVRGRYTHDVSLFSKSNIHVELHFDLIEDNIAQSSADILKDVWKFSYPKEGFKYHFEMPDEVFYFYHIAHMAKHFENGGCGIRPFIDLWILDKVEQVDVSKRNELLKQGNLLKFAQAARNLSKVWLENTEMDPISQQMENYILSGGVYGNNENRIAVQQQKKGGRLKYALSKIFIPYDVIKFHYPILQKHRWMTPFMEARRWCKLIFCGHAKRTLRELEYSQAISADKADTTKKFLSSIGL